MVEGAVLWKGLRGLKEAEVTIQPACQHIQAVVFLRCLFKGAETVLCSLLYFFSKFKNAWNKEDFFLSFAHCCYRIVNVSNVSAARQQVHAYCSAFSVHGWLNPLVTEV